MRALSLTQPWASLVVIGAKRIETRSWSTQFEGLVAIHASKKYPEDDRELGRTGVFRRALGAKELNADTLPTGAIVGTARIYGCRFTEDVENHISDEEQAFGNYEPGRFAWMLTDNMQFVEPIPCKGALGLWTVPVDVEREIKRRSFAWQ